MGYFMSIAQHHKKSLSLNSLAGDWGIAIVVALVIIAVYLLDTITPLGEPVWLLYFIPLILAYWSTRDYAIPIVCTVILLFLISGFLLSPEGVAVSQAIIYRYIFFIMFIGVALLLWAIRANKFW
jgi:hypothetical protein